MDTKGVSNDTIKNKACGLRSCKGKEYYCSVELSLAVLGGKWKPLILWHLGRQKDVMRFGQLKATIPRITQKMLTQQLRELEHDGIVARTVYAEVPPRVEYGLTELGWSIMPVLEKLCEWGNAFERTQGGGPVNTGIDAEVELHEGAGGAPNVK